MSLSRIPAQSHPTDARLKCVTREQVHQLAAAHRRTLETESGLHVRPEISALATPTSVLSAPALSDVLPDFSPHMADLTKQLASLQTHVATLQHQLVLLTDQLQKVQQSRSSAAETEEEKSLEPSQEKSLEPSQEKSLESPQEKSLEPSQEKSLESPQEKSLEPSQEKSLEPSQDKALTRASTNTPSLDRRKLPHVLSRVEYGAQGKYVVISPEQGMLEFEPDSPEWFTWLSTLSSFRFVGASGHLTVHRDPRRNPRWSWRASRHIRNRSYDLHLGRTELSPCCSP